VYSNGSRTIEIPLFFYLPPKNNINVPKITSFIRLIRCLEDRLMKIEV
jgi:hypothetical protein